MPLTLPRISLNAPGGAIGGLPFTLPDACPDAGVKGIPSAHSESVRARTPLWPSTPSWPEKVLERAEVAGLERPHIRRHIVERIGLGAGMVVGTFRHSRPRQPQRVCPYPVVTRPDSQCCRSAGWRQPRTCGAHVSGDRHTVPARRLVDRDRWGRCGTQVAGGTRRQNCSPSSPASSKVGTPVEGKRRLPITIALLADNNAQE